MTTLVDKARVEIKLGNYGVAPATALSDAGLLMRVQEYRRLASSRMVPLDAEENITSAARWTANSRVWSIVTASA
jgi:hypothetical protein